MRPRSPALRISTWMRLARGLVVAVVLALVPAPAAAAGGSARTRVDDVALVATARTVAAREARPGSATRARQVRHEALAVGGAAPLLAAPSLATPGRPRPALRGRRARLYLEHCALLR